MDHLNDMTKAELEHFESQVKQVSICKAIVDEWLNYEGEAHVTKAGLEKLLSAMPVKMLTKEMESRGFECMKVN